MKDDSISRHGTSAWLENMGYPNLAKMVMDEKRFPSTQPYEIHSDGRLWVTVDDIDKVNAVVVDESKSKFCKQFYMDAQPERKKGKWIHVSEEMWKCDQCGEISCCSPNFCPDCGADMRGGEDG